MSDLRPVAIFPRPETGKKVFYHHHEIIVGADGQLTVDDQPASGRCVQFNRRFGVGASCNCFALLSGDRLEIYEGSTTGPGMITLESVLAAVR